jgi:hypothetical protein
LAKWAVPDRHVVGGGWVPKRALLVVRLVADCSIFKVVISSNMLG